ncbi:MAG: prepilin-type N-terminal cleavage/methylation domain-containing protein [Armatimonadota bacterium]
MLKRRNGFTLVEIMIVVMIISVLLTIAIPNFFRAREVSRARSCQGNLRLIASAKEQWAMDNKMGNSDTPTKEALVPDYIKGESGVMPTCQSGGEYTIGDMSTWPACSISQNSTADKADDHVYWEEGG